MKKSQINIIQALKDRRLFGSLLADSSSWVAWVVWLKAAFGLPMDATELELYRQCTGRDHPPKVPPTEIYTIVGRRGGKSFISSLTAVYLAYLNAYEKYLSPGERAVILVLARDREQARFVSRTLAASSIRSRRWLRWWSMKRPMRSN